MTNPVSEFRNNLFASRGCNIQEALNYAEMMINTLSAVDQVSVRTAFGVVLNTIDSAVTQSQGPSPKLDQADMLSQLGGMYDKLVSDVATFKSDWTIILIDEQIAKHNFIREEALGDLVDEHIANLDDKIEDWMSNNFDLDNYDVDSSIEVWIENNLQEKVEEAIGNVEFNVTVK